ncbi:uncharacterized protein KGF55_003551 [Candida pseudojiufengensis]|uniref:uncharacterized protein n=1 Tax=Candida pseudojiufengensis TaxID=497109 RepID=UPI002224DA41|nr:uncharacterized protein KGF55_003551 [Candida pseudojiufengensis]KAI5962475.1 hypothetical protein KGF55_003551 [Candida pseudojiufengensis]
MDPNQVLDQQFETDFYNDFTSNKGLNNHQQNDYVITPESNNNNNGTQNQDLLSQKLKDINDEYSQLYPHFNPDNETNFQLNDMDFDFNVQQTNISQQLQQPLQQPLQHHLQQPLQQPIKNEDNMEVDDSPPFTLESDLYFDQGFDNNSIITSNNLPAKDFDSNRNRLSVISHHNSSLRSPVHHDSPYNEGSRVSSYHNVQNAMENNVFINNGRTYLDSNDHQHQQFVGNRVRNGSIDSYYAANAINQAHLQHKFNELSPLTTTTSNTHSISSAQSAQPSFFSAHQYLSRNSIDQTRPSQDLYGRPSIEGQPSQQQRRYISFTNSITNIIPFMGDKNQQRSPPTVANQTQSLFNNNQQQQPPQPAPPPPQKHLIKSIFKSQQNEQLDDSVMLTDSFLLMSPTKEEPEEETPKKVKSSKRSLFTRFKTNKEEEEQQQAPIVEPVQESSGSSIMTSSQVLEHSTSDSSQTNGLVEPDYAALFENVGKRKPPNRKKVKEETPQQSSFFTKNKKTTTASSQNSIGDSASGTNISLSSSNTSGIQKTSTNESGESTSSNTLPSTTTTMISSTTKRILGSKIMPKNNKTKKSIVKKEKIIDEVPIIASLDTPVATMISEGVEVQVDLASLDLPPDTKIFPTSIINSKNRTRGRKENKEADLNDESKIYLCNYCSRRFKRHEHLKRHFRSLHTFEKPYDCSICNKKFSRSDNLNQHLKIHKLEEEEAQAAKLIENE